MYRGFLLQKIQESNCGVILGGGEFTERDWRRITRIYYKGHSTYVNLAVDPLPTNGYSRQKFR